MKQNWFEVTPPYPRVAVRLPGNGGVMKGSVVGLKHVRDETWVQVTVPTWNHWRTQIEVGQPSEEGLAPGEQTLWVPGFACTADEGDILRLRRDFFAAHDT